MVEVIRLLAGTAVAIGLGFWAWRARSAALGGSALGYLIALWYLYEPVPPAPGLQFLSEEQFAALMWSVTPLPDPGYPEFALAAGAVVAHAHAHRVRPWHVLAAVGFVGALWEPMALLLCLAALVLAGYELHARRPGAWYPLLLVGVWLWLGEAFDGWFIAVDPPDEGSFTMVSATAVTFDHVDYDELALAVVVAAGLAVLAWRRRDVTVLLTAAAYLAGAFAMESPGWWLPEVPAGSVVLAGAAVAFATAAPRTARTAGRWAGTPGRRPGP
ncbi:hypothetical protein [Saccharothrix sp. NRRL B-16314]|uniref:hypothetical protein n=1 Tax=Saccharothrix sp. NRRL B-16314 TaxID=1463825 RepID=UPI0012DEB901|nr:hypothetical protein [Saccharothrix sp. NRRL B-16314]